MGHPIGILVIHKPHDATFRLILLVVYVMFIARPAITSGSSRFPPHSFIVTIGVLWEPLATLESEHTTPTRGQRTIRAEAAQRGATRSGTEG